MPRTAVEITGPTSPAWDLVVVLIREKPGARTAAATSVTGA